MSVRSSASAATEVRSAVLDLVGGAQQRSLRAEPTTIVTKLLTKHGASRPEVTAAGLALVGAGLRHWVNHRNDGCVLCAAGHRGGAMETRPMPRTAVPVGRKRGRWARRAVACAVVAVTWSKARRVLEQNDRQNAG